MKFRKLGNTDIDVSLICLGSMTWGEQNTQDDGFAQMDLAVDMPGNITFATSRYEIKSEFYPVLNSVSKVLAEFDKTVIKVSGHTDSTGSAEMNQTLSEQRADSVRQYLIQRKVASGRVHAVGYGPRYPVATNSTPEGRQANRRVELKLEPLQ